SCEGACFERVHGSDRSAVPECATPRRISFSPPKPTREFAFSAPPLATASFSPPVTGEDEGGPDVGWRRSLRCRTLQAAATRLPVLQHPELRLPQRLDSWHRPLRPHPAVEFAHQLVRLLGRHPPQTGHHRPGPSELE